MGKKPEKVKKNREISVKCRTVWKFQDFSVIQILREINLGESRSSETAILTIFRVLNFANWHISAFKKCKNV